MKKIILLFLLSLFIQSAFAQVTRQWVEEFGNINKDDAAFDVATDNNGNSYITGFTTDNSGISQCITIKYDDNGNIVWQSGVSNISNNPTRGNSVAVDNNLNVYIAGWVQNSANSKDFLVVKYDINGVQQWVSTYDGLAHDEDIVSDIGIDNSGNVYVIGNSNNPGIVAAVTIKYSNAGIQQWINIENNLTANFPVALDLDPVGNTYITYACAYGQKIIKYNTTGAKQWTDSIVAYSTWTVDITHDNAGVYIIGSTTNTMHGGYDYLTAKYTYSGTKLWSVSYDGPNGLDDNAFCVKVDVSGNVYVSGTTNKQITASCVYPEYTTIKYNSSGVL